MTMRPPLSTSMFKLGLSSSSIPIEGVLPVASASMSLDWSSQSTDTSREPCSASTVNPADLAGACAPSSAYAGPDASEATAKAASRRVGWEGEYGRGRLTPSAPVLSCGDYAGVKIGGGGVELMRYEHRRGKGGAPRTQWTRRRMTPSASSTRPIRAGSVRETNLHLPLLGKLTYQHTTMRISVESLFL